MGGGDVDLVEMNMFHTSASFSLQNRKKNKTTRPNRHIGLNFLFFLFFGFLEIFLFSAQSSKNLGKTKKTKKTKLPDEMGT